MKSTNDSDKQELHDRPILNWLVNEDVPFPAMISGSLGPSSERIISMMGFLSAMGDVNELLSAVKYSSKQSISFALPAEPTIPLFLPRCLSRSIFIFLSPSVDVVQMYTCAY